MGRVPYLSNYPSLVLRLLQNNNSVRSIKPGTGVVIRVLELDPAMSPPVRCKKMPVDGATETTALDLTSLSKVILLLAVFATAVPALRRQWQTDPAGFLKSAKVFAGFLVYSAIGIVILLALVPDPTPPGSRHTVLVFALIAFLLGWIFLGALWLARLMPRYQHLSAWVDNRFGPVDLTLIATIGLGLLVRFFA
ncbi:hypothetical protein [Hyphomicrobium sp. LHD-15]|uniref:hypothetical protein n=1 Tax=Hyphomicrobium sp. LHD-15 TaxID=3072142 RepID=UPI00280FA0F3|nr:hypothetical protein [Hyphomicrobium sp. LHD-15]MDQ8698902.1 hypothetical protein [Hyphomicrobium sp. LHD-15]